MIKNSIKAIKRYNFFTSLWKIFLILTILTLLTTLPTNVNAMEFDISKEDYKANFVSAGDFIRLSNGTFEKKLEILRVTDRNVLVKQDSGEIFIINLNESREIDLNSDRFDDVKISFNSYDTGKAELALSKLSDEIIGDLNNPDNAGVNEDKENKLKKFTYYLLGFVALLLALFLIKKLLKMLIRRRKYY